MKNRNLNLVSRMAAPTPKWFRILRNLGLTFSAIGGALVTAPITLPATLVTVGGYLLLGGTLIGAVSQTGICSEEYGKIPPKFDGKFPEGPVTDQEK